ncbi:hypothetical protein LMG29542_08741 [Paraburkholderia humisilvae]|uniref:Uncharacterized protein n=1 Tax=Paraburkholderia humisilvae TaxID=627669 RepID=A0A6J5F980_9BURK|nr:hypothetical protein LMG29542_08741 [Paraburkholderia humisilvae]
MIINDRAHDISSAPEPGFESRRLYTGHHVANKQVTATLIPGVTGAPSFDVVQVGFDASSAVHFRSSL